MFTQKFHRIACQLLIIYLSFSSRPAIVYTMTFFGNRAKAKSSQPKGTNFKLKKSFSFMYDRKGEYLQFPELCSAKHTVSRISCNTLLNNEKRPHSATGRNFEKFDL